MRSSFVPAGMMNDVLSASPSPETIVQLPVSPASGSLVESVPTSVPAGWFSVTAVCESVRSVGAALFVFKRMLTLFDISFATARSLLPSASQSATVTAYGYKPAVSVRAA